MKLMGINVDKKIECSCRLDFCKDDEMSWVVVRPCGNSDTDKIFLYENMEIGCIICDEGTFGGKIEEIYVGTGHDCYFKVNDVIFNEDSKIYAIGIVGEDNRPTI